MNITANQIHEAAQQIHPGIVHTPCTHSAKLSQLTGTNIFLKFLDSDKFLFCLCSILKLLNRAGQGL